MSCFLEEVDVPKFHLDNERSNDEYTYDLEYYSKIKISFFTKKKLLDFILIILSESWI